MIPKIASYQFPSDETWPACRAPWSLMPTSCALLVHDMQQYFLAAYRDADEVRGKLTSSVARLLAASRAANIPIFYSMQPGEQTDEARGLLRDVWGEGIVRHPELVAIADEVSPVAEDRIVYKKRYSAFFETTLAEELTQANVKQLLICGIYGHIGCLATAVDAFSQGFQPFVAFDAIADFSRQDHETALRQVARTCGVVTSTRRVEEALRAQPSPSQPATPKCLP